MDKSSDNRKKKPVIKINMAQTLDGHTIEPGGKWSLGSREDKRRMDRLRMWADCIIASRRSIENDDPNLFARSKPDARQPRPVIILKNSNRKIPYPLKIFFQPHPVGEFWVYGDTPLSLEQIIDFKSEADTNSSIANDIKKWKVYAFKNVKDIYNSLAERNFCKILLEGGPSLNGLFFQEDLIDEIYFTINPFLWGGETTDRIITTNETMPMQKFRLLNVDRRKDELFLRYKKIKRN